MHVVIVRCRLEIIEAEPALRIQTVVRIQVHHQAPHNGCESNHIHGRLTWCSRRSVPHLAPAIVAPALDAVIENSTGMVVSGSDHRHTTVHSTYIHRRVAVVRRAVAQLTVIVVAPALDAAVDDGTRVFIPGRDSCHAAAAAQPTHIHRCLAHGAGSVAQPAAPIVTPALGTPIDQRAIVIEAGTDSRHAATQSNHGHRCQTVYDCTIAQLAAVITAPTLHATTGCERAAMATACPNRRHAAG